MNRRKSLIALSALAGHACFPEVLARFGRALAEAEAWAPTLFTPAAGRVLAAAVDTILPDTDRPGARAAGVHQAQRRLIGTVPRVMAAGAGRRPAL